MPRNWLYYIALLLPLGFRILLLDTGFVEWLWYQHYEQAYYMLATLRIQPQFIQFFGGWKIFAFMISVICWWQVEDGESIPAQFLLLPLGYVPFAIAGDMLPNGPPENLNLYIYPLVIIPIGYAYVFTWTMLIWVLGKLGLTIS